MSRPSVRQRRLPAALATVAVGSAVIIGLAIALADHTDPGIFIPLFAPVGLAARQVYTSGSMLGEK